MKSVTLKDVAKAAGVSYATVSRALSGSPQIGSDTRERIIKLCDEMGYTTNYVARSMVMKKTDLIGLVVPSIDNQFMSELAYYAEMSARSHGYNIMLCNSGPDLKQEKTVVKLEDLEKAVAQQLELVHQGMFQRAKKNLEDHIYEAHTLEEAKKLQEENGGFVKTMWCGELECELKMKEVAGMSSRCIPFNQENLGDTCACCGKPAKHMIYWGVAY